MLSVTSYEPASSSVTTKVPSSAVSTSRDTCVPVLRTVTDTPGSALPGVSVTVRNTGMQVSRDVLTAEDGTFVVTELLAGSYEVTLSMTGFKTYKQTDINLSANERVALRPITLDLGQVTETVAVTAEAARVQTQSAERSGLITQEQLKEVTLKGRDYVGMLRLLPGVVDTANREAPAWNNIGGRPINGGATTTINTPHDGGP